MMRPVQNAAMNARYRSNLKREDRYTAGIAINQNVDSKVPDY